MNMSKKAKSVGEMELSEANEMNVPINIFIHDQGESDSMHSEEQRSPNSIQYQLD